MYYLLGFQANPPADIVAQLQKATARNSNFLLNVGPDKQGRIIESSRKALAAIPALRQK